jgi:hypothetical protein
MLSDSTAMSRKYNERSELSIGRTARVEIEIEHNSIHARYYFHEYRGQPQSQSQSQSQPESQGRLALTDSPILHRNPDLDEADL